MTHIINSQAITLIIQNKRFRVEKTDSRYATVIKNLEGSEDEMLKVLENRKVKDDAVKAGFIINSTEVTYKGEKLPTVLANKIRNIYNEGLPLALFEKFWENLQNNPSQTSVNELYDFLAYRELPINDRGNLIAYKGVNADYWSVNGNPDVIPLQGKTDSRGRIYNGVGETIQVRRRDVNDNRQECASFGLHIGSLNYASGWGSRVVIVEVNPAHVVSIPLDCSAQKCRVEQYTVVGDYEEEITAPVLDESNAPIESSDHIERKAVTKQRIESIERIDRYLTNKQQEGAEYVTIRQIQNIFSPEWISKQEVQDILQELEYSWKDDIVQIAGFDNDEDEEDDESRYAWPRR